MAKNAHEYGKRKDAKPSGLASGSLTERRGGPRPGIKPKTWVTTSLEGQLLLLRMIGYLK